MTSSKRSKFKFSLWALLVLMVPVALGILLLDASARRMRRAQEIATGHDAIYAKGIDLLCVDGGTEYHVHFNNANVSDGDLKIFAPALQGDAAKRWSPLRITGLRLNGSNVSHAALEGFRKSVPDCVIQR